MSETGLSITSLFKLHHSTSDMEQDHAFVLKLIEQVFGFSTNEESWDAMLQNASVNFIYTVFRPLFVDKYIFL